MPPLACTLTGAVLSKPTRCRVRSTLMNSAPSPYLKVTRRALTQRGMSTTSSCSTLTHSTGPIPPGKSKTSGSLKGSVVKNPLSRSQIRGGLRHSSMVVQMENDGANRYPRTSRLDPSRVPNSSISENR
ncbi:Uncharacterised protein [Mycobacteroides abscessus subsp. abscessus]|nr:Uncharacterised protein [Mycobacteroides abscessus subsp. abscessus]